jgi:AIPR protein
LPLRNFDSNAYDRLESRISELISNRLVAKRDQSLIYLFLRHRFFSDEETIRESFTDGGNDCGIDAVHIDRRGQEPVIHLFQSKVFESSRKAKNPFPESELAKVVRFMAILNDRDIDLGKVANPQLAQKIHEVRDIISKEFPSFKLWIISNGMPLLEENSRASVRLLEAADVALEQVHLHEVVEFCINRSSSRVNHVFYARDVGVIEAGDTELKSVVGYVSGQQLYNLLKDLRDERKIDYTLFNMNVRGFLGLDSEINREIFQSASSSVNSKFASLNNGITIVGTKLKVQRMGQDGPKISIKNMSIVNGAQTCSAIFDAMKDFYPDYAAFERLSILFRIFETEDQEMISQIALSTNNQNRIHSRDLRANSEEQIRLEQQLLAHGVRYIRKRGIFDDAESDFRSLDSLRAGQLVMSYNLLDPVRARRDSDSIFTDFYGKIFSAPDIDKLIEAYEWFELIERRRISIEDETRVRGYQRTEYSFIVYGSFHILMLCALIDPKAKGDQREQVIDHALELINLKLKDSGEPAYYSFFRDAKQAEALRNAALQLELFEGLKNDD